MKEKMIVPPFEGKLATVLIFGPPGSGKGTQGKFLSGAGGHYHLSSGDIFRGLSPKSAAGRVFRQYADKGELVPDEVTIEIWRRYVMGLIATNRYFPDEQLLLLDGIPRTKQQAQGLESILDVKKIIVLDSPDREVLIDRLLLRAKIEKRSDDKDHNVVLERMRIYDDQTAALLSYYPKELIATFNADQRPLKVLADLLNQLSSLLS